MAVENFLLIASSIYDTSDVPFTGQAIINLIRSCLQSNSTAMAELSNEIFDTILTFAVSSHLADVQLTLGELQLTELKKVPAYTKRFSRTRDRQLDEDGRSKTCILWVVMILRQGVGDDLVACRLERIQVALLRWVTATHTNSMMDCVICEPFILTSCFGTSFTAI